MKINLTNMSYSYKYIICFVIILISLKASICFETVSVKLKQGELSGTVEKTFLNNADYFSFRGIPYAEPPLGELRFKPPKPHSGWEGILDAHKNKQKCVQNNSKKRNKEKFGISGSEDCLYINVFTPKLDGSAAVLVFDYHDDFRTGYNGTKKYSPEILAEEDVVVVVINHRLSILGYLTTEDDAIPANNGLRDYLLGLQWINENIKHFGGDPGRVTLMGSKGGATLANIMLYSKRATGLFNAVTLQSGTVFEAIYFPENPRQYAFKLGELFDINTDDGHTLLTELQKIDVNQLYEKETSVIDIDIIEAIQRNVFPFEPVLEAESSDAILTALPEHSKIVNDVPVMIGYNSREGLDHASFLLFQPRILNSLKDFFVHFPIRMGFRFDINSTAFEQYKADINNFYFKEGYLNYNNILDYVIYVGDTLQNYAINYAARKMAKELTSPTYYYMFDFYGSLNEHMLFITKNTGYSIETWGASVGDELCYLHVCGFIRDNYKKIKDHITVQNEIKVMKKMIRLWANFAKTGNPTPNEYDPVLKSLTWHPIDKDGENLKYLHMRKNFRMEINPLGKREAFWDTTLKKYGEMVIDGVAHNEEQVRDEL
ncbi:hypothetical protein ACJJTC_006907 [Scirpophaga incertulas]